MAAAKAPPWPSELRFQKGPAQISRDKQSRRLTVELNARGRDLGKSPPKLAGNPAARALTSPEVSSSQPAMRGLSPSTPQGPRRRAHSN